MFLAKSRKLLTDSKLLIYKKGDINLAKQITQYDLLISCPFDVKKELEIIKETVESFNRMYGDINNVSINVKHWSTNSYPESGNHPQNLLNKQFVLDCDAAVAVFWTRFGTPTDEYGSGTEEEIEELIKNGKQVFLYFSDCQVSPSLIDQEQYQKVCEFRKKYTDKGIYWPYSNLEDFKKLFLNHLSLHFVKLFNTLDVSSNSANSKLYVRGVVNGKVTDQVFIFQSNFLNCQLVNNLKSSIINKYQTIKSIVIPVKDIEINDKVSNKEIMESVLNKEIGETVLKWQEAVKSIPSIFPSSKVEIDKGFKDIIINYLNDNNIFLNEDKFFNIGDLSKQQSPFGGGDYGMYPSVQLVGSDEEKKKYELIKELYWKIKKHQEFIDYFNQIDDKYYLELALSNVGTSFDEDIDVKVFIQKGILCMPEQLPIPGDNILDNINEFVDLFLKPNKTIYINEYDGYPIIEKPSFNPSSFALLYNQDEDIKSKRKEYKNSLGYLFQYEFFQTEKYDVICYNQKYIKQNTSFFFPTILVFNEKPDKILYEITSKHYPDIIKGELTILEVSK